MPTSDEQLNRPNTSAMRLYSHQIVKLDNQSNQKRPNLTVLTTIDFRSISIRLSCLHIIRGIFLLVVIFYVIIVFSYNSYYNGDFGAKAQVHAWSFPDDVWS